MFTPVFMLFFSLCLLFPTSLGALEDEELLQGAGRGELLDLLLQGAINRNLVSGAVLLVGNSQKNLFLHATGRGGFGSEAKPLRTDTLFDVASLTKVFATTPAVIRLLDQGRLSLLDPISNWFPEFSRSNITVLNLLTHTSGLSDLPLDSHEPLSKGISRAARQAGKIPAGSRFLYADINFILLGNLVRRITSYDLDEYCQDAFYRTMGMGRTGFNPSVSDGNIASTLGGKNGALNGVAQDHNARLLGGVAGHAGLFSTAEDLATFVRMLLNGGRQNDRQLFSPRAVSQMIAPYYFRNGTVIRGLGWDMESPFSSPKGAFFSEGSFGHTGYSGTSVWVDPERDLFVILLTTRLEYNDRRSFNRLRSDISTLSAALYSGENARGKVSQLSKNTAP